MNLGQWRCEPFAFHLAEWLPDYALPEEELSVNHANSLVKINQAAIRVYTSKKYEKRGEAGEIALHAVCRDFFGTIPISPRVFYKSASNDVVKAFDMVHARLPQGAPIEIWLGESKLWEDGSSAIGTQFRRFVAHRSWLPLKRKTVTGTADPKNNPSLRRDQHHFQETDKSGCALEQCSLRHRYLMRQCLGQRCQGSRCQISGGAKGELAALTEAVKSSGLATALKIVLVYVPLAGKAELVEAFDARLKGLQ